MPLASPVAITGNSMGASSLFLAAVAALAGAGIAVVLWRMRQRAPATLDPVAAARQREERAAALGWRYDDRPNGETLFTLRGEEGGVKWKVRYRDRSSQSEERPKLTWATRSVQGATTELRLIGRARYEHSRTHVEPVIEKFTSLIMTPREIGLAQARAEFIERTVPTEVGSGAFRERFVVIARNDRLARALIDEKVEGLLTKWGCGVAAPDKVLSIWLDWQGLRIDVDHPCVAMREIEQLVALGLALAGRYRRHAAAPGVTRWMETKAGA
jgi:hypothetical protein